LHLGALAHDESPIDWKPSVCWKLSIKVDWVMRDDEVDVASVRGRKLPNWGDHSDTMAWSCTARRGLRASPQFARSPASAVAAEIVRVRSCRQEPRFSGSPDRRRSKWWCR
jgi:hypothetical protein